jgi:hypothetical protein
MFCNQMVISYLRNDPIKASTLINRRLAGEVKISQIRLFHGWKEVRIQRSHSIF